MIPSTFGSPGATEQSGFEMALDCHATQLAYLPVLGSNAAEVTPGYTDSSCRRSHAQKQTEQSKLFAIGHMSISCSWLPGWKDRLELASKTRRTQISTTA